MSQASILIVEDELLIAKNTAKKLKKLGYKVLGIVSSGQKAIESVAEQKPDLILMDIAIKGEIDGIETASRIRSKLDIPIIFLTAYASEDTLERASKTGCYGYMIKPCKEKELQATIKMTLNKHQEQSTIQDALKSTLHQYSNEYDDIYQDKLTGLPNKLFLRDLFDYLLSMLEEAKTQDDIAKPVNQICVINISLERLNKIFDFLPKEHQDILMQKIATRLTDCVYDFGAHGSTVIIKPDNLVVLLATDERGTGFSYGESILQSLKQNFIIGDREIFLSPTIGLSFCPTDSSDIEELLNQGYKAIEYANTQGGNRCQAFTFAFKIKHSKASDELRLESELHYALERQQLELFYQPQIDLKRNLICGTEALVRWNHPQMGRIDADRFIPLAEDLGLTRSIGEWVLEAACKQTQWWHENGLKNLRVSVNLSGAQFRQSDLFHKITQILFETSLEPQYLGLELTENILVENIKANVQRLNLLKKLGITISLDDFGTGYSSLGYLQQFPFDILKIDACFIRNINKNQVNAVITRTIIDMAHQLGLKVVAEGVENTTELNFLKEAQCDVAQGYLLSRPLSTKEFQTLAFKNITEQTMTFS